MSQKPFAIFSNIPTLRKAKSARIRQQKIYQKLKKNDHPTTYWTVIPFLSL
ncbi:hypothetical protein BAOM_1012 [Peribacillus asahii]|uniref:Uncharacterized protein n=1 Tax=Peribacillus asahii TaxID=228899 RepID=A0A3T0KMX6_9BACI|nr:hypothetical protein BAOM_1012 [Peribacillus asahii]